MKRGKPLKRTGFTSKAPVNTERRPRAPIRPRSKARATHMRTERIPAIETMVEEGRTCEVCPVLAELGIPVRCTGVIQGLHERRKSGAGGSRSHPANLVPACNAGNGLLEDAVGPERELIDNEPRLVLRYGPEFDAMGARAWRER